MSDETFEGFVPPVDDYFRMPNEWINICAKMDSLAELKVVQYVLRHTWGYQGFSGARKITIDEFMHGRKRKDGSRIDDGTGLSKQSVITAVELAIKHGYLVCEKDDKDKARQKKYYQLAMKSDVKDLDIETDVKNLDIPGVKDLDPDVKTLDSDGQEFRHRSEKDTIERHLEKNTLETQESIAPTPLSQKTALPSRAKPIKFEEQAQRIIDKRQTDPALPAVKPQQKPTTPQSQVSGPPDVAPPASVGKGTAQAGAGKRTQEKKKVTQADAIQPVPKCSTKEIQARINAYRGYALEEEVEIIRERKAIKTWCNLHEIGEYDLVLHYLTTLDPYWKKPENKYRIGGLTLLKETPKALAEMERRHNGKTHQGPPDYSKAELVDEQWNIYKIPGDDTEYTYWPLVGGKLMPVAEADLLGYNGGAGLYNVTQYKERAAR